MTKQRLPVEGLKASFKKEFADNSETQPLQVANALSELESYLLIRIAEYQLETNPDEKTMIGLAKAKDFFRTLADSPESTITP